MSKEHIKPNEWVYPVPDKYIMACCDCGLAHEMDFEIVYLIRLPKKLIRVYPIKSKDLAIRFRARRSEKMTEKIRKKYHITIKPRKGE